MSSSDLVRARDAFRHGMGVAPAVANDDCACGGISVCEWRVPWLDGFDLAENDDFIIAHHSAGSQRVRAACNGPWSAGTSVPGLISVIPPGRRVQYCIEGAVTFSSIHIPRRLLDNLLAASGVGQSDFRFAFEDEFVRASMQILLAATRRASAGNFLYFHTVTRALLVHLLTGEGSVGESAVHATPADENACGAAFKLDATLHFIETRLCDPLTVTDLADRVGISRAHFTRRFRATTGMSPHRYLILRRIERAKSLLRHSSASVAKIALEVGFSSQAHFTQMFHSVSGLTPRQYRYKRES